MNPLVTAAAPDVHAYRTQFVRDLAHPMRVAGTLNGAILALPELAVTVAVAGPALLAVVARQFSSFAFSETTAANLQRL